jgi:hypothetical protein
MQRRQAFSIQFSVVRAESGTPSGGAGVEELGRQVDVDDLEDEGAPAPPEGRRSPSDRFSLVRK